jgi:hypothetical protein
MVKKSFLSILVGLALVLSISPVASGIDYDVQCFRYDDAVPSWIEGRNVCAGSGGKCYECIELNTFTAGVGSSKWKAGLDIWNQLNALPTAYSY